MRTLEKLQDALKLHFTKNLKVAFVFLAIAMVFSPGSAFCRKKSYLINLKVVIMALLIFM